MQIDGRPEFSPVETLANEVRLLWNTLVQAGEELHAGEPVSMGMRAVLEYLLRNGPATVPGIARSRHVTRQHIQQLVNPLLGQDLVRPTPNPAHKRSVLVSLSPKGEEMIRRMLEREAGAYQELDLGLSNAELLNAAETLRRVRQAFGALGGPQSTE
jgi:DNA-binding MarR family transcriptional regulator